MRAAELKITPAEVELRGPRAIQQLVVTRLGGKHPAGVTGEVEFQSLTPSVVEVDAAGLVRPLADGMGQIAARLQGTEATVEVRVSRASAERPISFENDVLPVLTVHGCNAGACHGKQRGQNGFQLSLLGFDPDFDYAAIVLQSRGRRVFPAAPEESLLLEKPAARVPHGGGNRLDPQSTDYRTVRRWIAEGMPRRVAGESTLERIEIFPTSRIMAPDAPQQLIVTAFYADGTHRDVTRLSAYQSNENAIAEADAGGLIRTGPLPGEAAIMARYMGHIATCLVSIPHAEEVPAKLYAELPRNNFIDEHVWRKLERLRITPSPPATEATVLRRLYLDVIGRLPTPDEARAFLDDTTTDKRARLIDALLARPEYADHWASQWIDLLRPNPYRVGIKAVLNYDAWIRDAFRRNEPYDQFVRELITAQGSTWRNGATVLFRDRRSPDEVTTMVSQLFLGIRLECAKCHHHPFESWGQKDFYRFAAYFARVGHKGTGLSPPISGGEEMIFTATSGSVSHPRTGEKLEPAPLFGQVPKVDDDDPRAKLAAWITSPENPFFEQVMANRIWTAMMGRGLVEPVDDLRATNPATNQPLLEALGRHFHQSGYDIKALIRAIANSYVYGIRSLANENNVSDTRNYSRYYRQRLRAEVLAGAVSDVTGVEDRFAAMPLGSRPNQIWTNRIDSLFLDTFGRPDRNQDPPCERTPDTSVVQALHLMNSPQMHGKVSSDSGRAAQLSASDLSPAAVIEELYLTIYSRRPTDAELTFARGLFEQPKADRRRVTEDLMWAMINTPEFIFKN